MKKSEYDYNERPKIFERNDFWRQVRRTINGQPVNELQLKLIVDQILMILDLCNEKDLVLDIGCGNGALSARLEPYIGKLHGIDSSDYLIEVANEFFSSNKLTFEQKPLELIIRQDQYKKFNKVLLYGVASFLTDELLQELVTWYFEKNNGKMMLGNSRDRECAGEFYGHDLSEVNLDDTYSSMGKWRERAWFEKLAEEQKIKVTFFKMPSHFYASKYYFDVLLSKK